MLTGILVSRKVHGCIYWNTFPSLKVGLFERMSWITVILKWRISKEQIGSNQEVCNFVTNWLQAFVDFSDFLNAALVEPMRSVNMQLTQSGTFVQAKSNPRLCDEDDFLHEAGGDFSKPACTEDDLFA